MTFTEDFNSNISIIKNDISMLFDRAKKQVISLDDKSNSSITELSSIFSRDSLLEDTFVDGSKVFSTENLVYDKDGWTPSLFTREAKFIPDYYTKGTFPMSMVGGVVIPGSSFYSIFNNTGFWGYMRNDNIPVPVEFTLSMDLTNGIPHLGKVYLRTNSVVDVELYYRESSGGSLVSLGIRSGQHHVWTGAFDAVDLTFKAVTNIFPIALVQAAIVNFDQSGKLTTNYREVENLRLMSIETDADIPNGTAIRTFVHISDTLTEDPPASGLIPWEEENIVTLANQEFKGPSASGTLIPSGYIESSLVIKTGYLSWDTVNSIDYSVVTESVDRLADSTLDIPQGHLVVSGGLTSLYLGQGDARTDFSQNDDYVVAYDLDANTVKVSYVNGGRLPTTPEEQPTAEIILRRPTQVAQRRTFVDLDIDRDITVSIPTFLTIRTLHVGDTIEDEITVENPPIGIYTFPGKKGLNLIEIENFDVNNLPQLVGSYNYFSTRYHQQKSETTPPNTNEYYLEPINGGLKLVSSNSDLWVRYLVPTGNNNVSIQFQFEGNGDVAPTLRSYKIINHIDTV
jgi:hypothetical protein